MSTIGGVNWRRIGKILKDFFLFNVVTSNIVPVTMSLPRQRGPRRGRGSVWVWPRAGAAGPPWPGPGAGGGVAAAAAAGGRGGAAGCGLQQTHGPGTQRPPGQGHTQQAGSCSNSRGQVIFLFEALHFV